MSSVNKKSATQLNTRSGRLFFDSLSKAALVDLYVDLLRSSGGGELLDGVDLINYAKETNLETVLGIRGDKLPKVVIDK